MARLCPASFNPTLNLASHKPYTYKEDGFEATHYDLFIDQLGTQLDPPAHWNPDYPAIDELPPTFAVRPLVVISIVDKVAKNPGYHLTVDDVLAWEKKHGQIPGGSAVFIRSNWSKEWPDAASSTPTDFPGVKLAALKFLHKQRKILLHGHEPLDTDTAPNLGGRSVAPAERLHSGRRCGQPGSGA
jgi:kynurenine formamidase